MKLLDEEFIDIRNSMNMIINRGINVNYPIRRRFNMMSLKDFGGFMYQCQISNILDCEW